MIYHKRIFLFLIVSSIISCGKNHENEEHKSQQNKEPNFEHEAPVNPESQKNDTTYKIQEDSIIAVKESVLRKKNYKKKKQTVANGKIVETPKTETIPQKTATEKMTVPSFVYIKKILDKCKIGVPMTQEELSKNFDIPEEGIKLVKSLTKTAPDELDIKWKSTWLIEKMSDAKFKDGKLKLRFDKNKMYTSGGAIAIKYEKKMYTDLYLIGRSAYIPTVKGYYWQIGN